MRTYTPYADFPQVYEQLNVLADRNSQTEAYQKAFFQLGTFLSDEVRKLISPNENLVVACSSEDADWLAKGIIEKLSDTNVYLSVFWNLQTDENLPFKVAPIVKSYIEAPDICDTLIICKSVIYTSCVVRTNLTFLIERLKPKQILIVAPVIFKDSENTLKTEFQEEINTLFKFIYFAKDDEVNEKKELIPGIGGSIYERLGLSNKTQEKKYIPEIVKERRLHPVH